MHGFENAANYIVSIVMLYIYLFIYYFFLNDPFVEVLVPI